MFGCAVLDVVAVVGALGALGITAFLAWRQRCWYADMEEMYDRRVAAAVRSAAATRPAAGDGS